MPSTSTPTLHREDRLPSAHSLREAADTDNTLEGYVAMNNVNPDALIAQAAEAYPVDLHEDIARLAYQLYLDRQGAEGSADDDWYRAEKELKAQRL